MMIDISESTALVTGANRGIGASLVEALVAAGAKRVYAAARTPSPATSDRVVPIALDVTDEARVAEVAALASDVQILVNNAGISRSQPLLAGAHDAPHEEMRVNYFGTLAMCRAFAPVLARNGGGAIVNLLSILARAALPSIGSYSASKAAEWSLTQSIRAELAAQGTLVVGVMPGFVDTDMTSGLALPKLAPSAVAAAILDALRTGTEDVYPGEAAAAIASELQRDPKAVERRFASFATSRRPA
jgi:NAD(P)-dependent dehydrogenase (short-subunit alcohol dehydrogenase family)